MNSKERIAKALEVSTDTKFFELDRDCLGRVPDVYNKFFSGRKALVVSSAQSWEAAGKKVFEIMKAAGIPAQKYVYERGLTHALWKDVNVADLALEGDLNGAKTLETDVNYVESDAQKAFRPVSDDYFIAVSVGSGVINDLCKLASYHHGQRYLSVPTAASVDGFSSFGASISYHSSKQTFDCPAPIALLADVNVLKDAPKSMTSAGYADLAAKIPAGAEWMIADLVGAEPIVPSAWHVLQDYLDDLLSDPEGVAAGKPEAISDLFEGLTLSGFAMQAAKSSRPASACDHLFSHILDMTNHTYHGKSTSHGFQVAIGTLTMCAVFDKFLTYDFTKLDVDKCVASWPSLEQEQQRAIEVFKDFPAPMLGYENITKKYTDAAAVRKELNTLKSAWPEFREKLRNQVYSFAKMQDLLKKAGAPYDPSMIGVTRKELKNMFPIVQLMRWRFNVLDLAKRCMVYDDLVDSVFAPGGAWDLNAELPISS
jgi:glycerol-1-phosphate dehydrogenase [NAD(P)+]